MRLSLIYAALFFAFSFLLDQCVIANRHSGIGHENHHMVDASLEKDTVLHSFTASQIGEELVGHIAKYRLLPKVDISLHLTVVCPNTQSPSLRFRFLNAIPAIFDEGTISFRGPPISFC